jgi:hypothetical protein
MHQFVTLKRLMKKESRLEMNKEDFVGVTDRIVELLKG